MRRLCRDEHAAKEADAARAELAAAAKAAAVIVRRAEVLVPALTDQAGEMAGACGRAKKMEEGLAAAASQAAQQQRRVEQLERAALASAGLPELAKVPTRSLFLLLANLVSPRAVLMLLLGAAVLNPLVVGQRRRGLPATECLLDSRQAGTAQMPLWAGSSLHAEGSSVPWSRQQGSRQR